MRSCELQENSSPVESLQSIRGDVAVGTATEESKLKQRGKIARVQSSSISATVQSRAPWAVQYAVASGRLTASWQAPPLGSRSPHTFWPRRCVS